MGMRDWKDRGIEGERGGKDKGGRCFVVRGMESRQSS